MKKLLMLGASFASKELVAKAKRRGWHVTVTDNTPPERSPVKQAADDFWMISTSDTDLLEERCRAEGIDAVFAGVSEFNLDRVRIMAEDLGLPCYIDDRAWSYARNKRLFKDKCREKGIPVVPEYPLPAPGDPAAWERIEYPVVVKPVDGAGNAGLSICRSRQELEDAIRKARSFSSHPEILIEKYISGEETWNYYCVAENKVRYLYSGRVFRQPGYPTFLYSFGTTAVGSVDEYLDRMEPQCSALLEEIGCRDGVAWIQCIRDGDGRFYALEMAHRLSADASGDILEKSLGFNITDWMLDTALGTPHSADMLPSPIGRPYRGALCVNYLFAGHAGTIGKMTGLDGLDPECFQVETAVDAGVPVEQYRLMVKIVFHGRDTGEICTALDHINRTVGITDTDGQDLVIRFTDLDAVRKELRGLMRSRETG